MRIEANGISEMRSLLSTIKRVSREHSMTSIENAINKAVIYADALLNKFAPFRVGDLVFLERSLDEATEVEIEIMQKHIPGCVINLDYRRDALFEGFVAAVKFQELDDRMMNIHCDHLRLVGADR